MSKMNATVLAQNTTHLADTFRTSATVATRTGLTGTASYSRSLGSLATFQTQRRVVVAFLACSHTTGGPGTIDGAGSLTAGGHGSFVGLSTRWFFVGVCLLQFVVNKQTEDKEKQRQPPLWVPLGCALRISEQSRSMTSVTHFLFEATSTHSSVHPSIHPSRPW